MFKKLFGLFTLIFAGTLATTKDADAVIVPDLPADTTPIPNEVKVMQVPFSGSLPRGIRNNNAGNLVQTNIQWQGKVPRALNTDSRFEQFYLPEYGLRALIKDILNDYNVDGKKSVAALISEFAPTFENNTAAYIQSVSNKLGVISTEDARLNDPVNLIIFVKAVVDHENGNRNGWYDDETYLKALHLAGVDYGE